jgi:hypothetical protein
MYIIVYSIRLFIIIIIFYVEVTFEAALRAK